VIELALANNRDLRIAALGIEKAQALYRIQRSACRPTSGHGVGQEYRIPKSMPELGNPGVFREYTVEAGISSWSWISSGGCAASRRPRSSSTGHRAGAVGDADRIVGTVASGYFALAADEEHLALSKTPMICII